MAGLTGREKRGSFDVAVDLAPPEDPGVALDAALETVTSTRAKSRVAGWQQMLSILRSSPTICGERLPEVIKCVEALGGGSRHAAAEADLACDALCLAAVAAATPLSALLRASHAIGDPESTHDDDRLRLARFIAALATGRDVDVGGHDAALLTPLVAALAGGGEMSGPTRCACLRAVVLLLTAHPAGLQPAVATRYLPLIAAHLKHSDTSVRIAAAEAVVCLEEAMWGHAGHHAAAHHDDDAAGNAAAGTASVSGAASGSGTADHDASGGAAIRSRSTSDASSSDGDKIGRAHV